MFININMQNKPDAFSTVNTHYQQKLTEKANARWLESKGDKRKRRPKHPWICDSKKIDPEQFIHM